MPVLCATGYGLYAGWQWYQHLPKPETVSATVQAPGITPIVDDKLAPEPLRIAFEKSVAPLERLDKPVTSGVKLEPSVPGKWKWESDRVLRFEPAQDWPAATNFRVIIDRSALAPHILLSRYTFPWFTPKFTARIRSLEFYQNPVDLAVKQVVATVDFSHPVDEKSLTSLAAFTMLGLEKTQPFEVKLDKFQRTAYLRTSAITLPEREDFMKLLLPKGILTPLGSATTGSEVESKVRVPDIYSFFRINQVTSNIVLNAAGEPEQFLVVDTTAAAKSEDVAKALSLYAIPQKKVRGEPDCDYDGPREITDTVLKASKVVPLKVIPSRDEFSRVHTFGFHLDKKGQLYVKIAKGLQVPGGYLLGENYDALLRIPEPVASINFEGQGGLLALNGERKISVKSRSVPNIEYQIARVATSQINHLVSQTEGNFQHPEFISYSFNEENISRLGTEHQPLSVIDSFKANYSAFDFGPHLTIPKDGGSERGLFFLKARGWDPATNQYMSGVSDSRFILVTDLGLIVKQNADESRDVFVASVKSGLPLAHVKIELIGKNGVPLASGETDAVGRVSLPSMKGATRDRKPVAITARLAEDIAFLPYAAEDRDIDFSRFDVGGITSASGDDLQAFLFTERGIYRPGDSIHSGYMVKSRNWQKQMTGLPIELEVRDAKGQAILVQRTTVPAGGFGELEVPTTIASPSGIYNIDLYLVRDNQRDLLLNSTSAWVKEFLPDRMKITSKLSAGSNIEGWITPDSVQAKISLQNLYGTPATDRRIKGSMKLSPTGFGFASYPDYHFYDRLLDGAEKPKFQEVDLGDTKTDEAGAAQFDLHLERFANATYAMTLYTEGFEADNGRSVTAQNRVLVSPLSYVVGYKPDGDLGYISRGLPRSINFIALDHELEKIAVTDLHFRLIERTFVSVLTKQESGSYTYESVERDREVKNEAIPLSAEGLNYPIDTAEPGNFLLEVLDPSGLHVSSVPFTVVGSGAVTRSMEKDAELEMKLPRQEYQAGDDLEIAITAPYTGSGLITIERDKVYAQAWFQASNVSSVQHIRVPEGLEGTAYVNVTFVRGLDSREIFASPLSYAVAPITVNREKRRLAIQLDAPKEAKPGQPFVIKYQADRPCRIAVYAVDQGILQVSDYQLPDPLATFFSKLALLVGTSQIVDLILPEFSILRSLSAPGGGEDLLKKELNPFQRVTEKPVVFWSGIIDADQTPREVTYDVPDYFNGTLKVMAVAYCPEAAGSTERTSLIRSRYVISPGLPTVVAPGDTFEVGVTVNNGGNAADVQLTAEPSEQLEIVKAPTAALHLEQGREATVTFTVRATERLGSGRLAFHAVGDGEESIRQATVSVRPATPFVTDVRSARFTKPVFEMPLDRLVRPEFRKLEATVSALPLGLAHGLDVYLKNYPYGCSEQITSGAFCRLMLSGEADFGLTRAEIAEQLEHTFAVERQRQNDQGGFGYWNASPSHGIDFISVYVTHFLVEAKAAGFAPPPDMLAAALRNLQRMAGESSPSTLAAARAQAYAIYVLTREDVITTNYIINLRDTLDRDFAAQWKSDLTAVYLGGALALLKHDDEGAKLVRGYRIGTFHATDYRDYFSRLGGDSQYVAILARHFPALLKKLPPEDFLKALEPIEQGRFSTLSAAYAVLALKSYSQLMAQSDPQLALSEILKDGKVEPVATRGDLTRMGEFSAVAKALRFSGHPPALGLFAQAVTAGFDQNLPAKPVEAGLEIFREYPATAHVGDPITVKLKVRSLQKDSVSNCAVVDLLPGGFEVVGTSIQPGAETVPGWDFVEVREDRVVFFGSVSTDLQEISYQIKATNRGEYLVPPPFVESMYDRAVHGSGVGQKITVTDAK